MKSPALSKTTFWPWSLRVPPKPLDCTSPATQATVHVPPQSTPVSPPSRVPLLQCDGRHMSTVETNPKLAPESILQNPLLQAVAVAAQSPWLSGQGQAEI